MSHSPPVVWETTRLEHEVSLYWNNRRVYSIQNTEKPMYTFEELTVWFVSNDVTNNETVSVWLVSAFEMGKKWNLTHSTRIFNWRRSEFGCVTSAFSLFSHSKWNCACIFHRKIFVFLCLVRDYIIFSGNCCHIRKHGSSALASIISHKCV